MSNFVIHWMILTNQFEYLKRFEIEEDENKDEDFFEQILFNGHWIEELILPRFHLNIRSFLPHVIDDKIFIKYLNTRLKELYLTFDYRIGRLNDIRWENTFDQLIIGIHLFSSSFKCWSLNLIFILELKEIHQWRFDLLLQMNIGLIIIGHLEFMDNISSLFHFILILFFNLMKIFIHLILIVGIQLNRFN